jgi:hypothetical protein
LRTSNDSPLINIELGTEIDQALLRITEFGPDERSEHGLDEPLTPPYDHDDDAEAIDNDLADVFPARETGNVTETIKRLQAGLNDQQKLLFEKVHKKLLSVNPEESPLFAFVSGAGSVGKSHMIHLLSLLIRNIISEDSLLISALSGKVANLIGGSTLHRTYALSNEFDKNGDYNKLGARKLAQLRLLYKNVKYIIIDEISMVNYESFRMIHNRFFEIFDNDEFFGGRNILLFGDLCQLSPQRGSPIYKKPNKYNAEPDLWRQFEFIELTQNMRLTGNDPLLEIFNRLRFGELNSDDIETLQSRLIMPNRPNFEEMEEEFRDVVRIVPSIAMCNKYNKLGTKSLKTRVYKINAYDTYGDGAHFREEVDKRVSFRQKKTKLPGCQPC